MSVAVLIDRISLSLSEKRLSVLPDRASTVPVQTIGDLLRPWGEIYPWCDEGRYGSKNHCLEVRPRFEGTRRRSRRPLPAPRKLTASHKLISPELFESVHAVWDWYQENGYADEQLLQEPCNGMGLSKFVENLWTRASDYSPMDMFLEEIGEQTRLIDLNALHLMLPCYSYQDEGGGVLEAFLTGVHGLHGLLEHVLVPSENPEFDLPKQDRKLIEEVGLQTLVQTYYDNDAIAGVPLKKLENLDENFFSEVKEKYPDLYDRDFVIIAGDGGWESELNIIDKTDIDFAFAWSEAYQSMMSVMPDPYCMLDNSMEGTAETFVHEVCEVWRKVNGKRSVKWTSEKHNRLAARFRREEL
jgi:hypothetical protein